MDTKSFVLLMIFAIICISAMGSVSAADSPSANFTSNTTNGSAPLSVQFNDTSKGSPTSWYWNFGDGNTSDKQNPVHNYTKNGNYNVSLTVANDDGSDSLTKNNYITVLPTVNTSKTGGTYKTAQTVQLTCSDTTAAIYYAADTTDPRTSSTRTEYSGPITINKTTTLRYAALDANGNWSQLYIQNYVIGSSKNSSNTGLSNCSGPAVNTTLWNYTTGVSIQNKAGLVIGSDGTIYVGSSDNKLYALNPDGTLKWTYTTGAQVSGPAIGSDGTIYVGSYDKYLYALNPDGTLKWKYKTHNAISNTPNIGSDGTIYFGSIGDNLYSTYSNLYALNPDGTLKWIYNTGETGGFYSQGRGAAIGSDGTIYIGDKNGILYAVNSNGTLKWSKSFKGNIYGSPTVGPDGTIYIGADKFYALNPDGTIKWNSTMGYIGVHYGAVIGSDGTIYLGSDNKLYSLNLDGTVKWNCTLAGYIYSVPTVGSDDTIYVGDTSGKLYAFSPTGILLWNYSSGGSISSSVVIGANENLYFGSGKNVYAIANTVLKANQTAGAAPLTVQFNGSGVSPVSWYWDFGDGTNSTEQNPVHIYNNAGYYTVTLNVTSSDGQNHTMSFTQYVKVYNLPVSNFTLSMVWGTIYSAAPSVYNSVNFKDISSNDPTSWLWDFGDGVTSTEQNPAHVYTTPGLYTVTLTATNPAGNSTYSITIQVTGTISVNNSLACGTYNTTKTVSLICDDPAAIIYYTKDTTDPRTSSTRIEYTGPITIDSTTTLRYAAVTYLGKWSQLYIQNYVIGNGGIADSPGSTYQENNNHTGLSNYTGPQTNNTKWNNTAVILQTGGGDIGVTIGSDGTIYAGGNGYLYAFYPTGLIKWKYYTETSMSFTPTIGKNGNIYFVCENYAYAINPDGTLKWKICINNGHSLYRSVSIGADGTIYAVSTDESGYLDTALYAINQDGTLKWNTTIANAGLTNGNLAIGPDGTIYVPGSTFYAVNPDGTIKWTYAFKSHQYSSPSIGADGTIYILDSGYSNDGLHALNPDGTLKWIYTAAFTTKGTASVGSDGTIYLLIPGKLIAINPTDGTSEWNCTLKMGFATCPLIGADGTIYCAGYKGIFALSSNGTVKWNYTYNFPSISAPVIGSDGTLYVETSNGLFAFRDIASKFIYTIGSNPLIVQFNDTSNNATSWNWNFGDGTTSTLQSPVHTYTKSGQYIVTLNANTPDGILTAAQIVTISDITPPTVTVNPNGGVFATAEDVNLNATDDSDNLVLYYTTDNSDPKTSSTRHTYTGPINVSHTTTIKYAAVDSSGNWSPVYVETYIKSNVSGVSVSVLDASSYGVGTLNDEIQAILDNAAPGTTINFLGKAYEGLHLVIHKQLNLISGGTTINTSSSLPVFLIDGIQASETTIKGFTINTGINPGIVLNNTNNITISNNQLNSTNVTVFLNNTSNVTLTNDQMSSTSGTAVLVNGSSNTTIMGSSIHDSPIGINVSCSNGTQINTNNIYNNTNGINIENSENTGVSENQIMRNTENGVNVINSKNTVISGNTITQNGITSNGSGIYLENSTGISIDGNLISANFYGMTTNNMTSATISSNEILSNVREGVLLNGNTKDTLFLRNTVQKNNAGINVNCISDNLIIRANLITENVGKISTEGCGAGIYFGKDFVELSPLLVEHNIVLKNNNPNNGNQGFQTYFDGMYVHGSNWYDTMCTKIWCDPKMIMVLNRTGKNTFTASFIDGLTGEMVKELPYFNITFTNGQYSKIINTNGSGQINATFADLANGDVTAACFDIFLHTPYNSQIIDSGSGTGNGSGTGTGTGTGSGTGNGSGSGTGTGTGSGTGTGTGTGSGTGSTNSGSGSGSDKTSTNNSASASDLAHISSSMGVTAITAAAGAAGSNGQGGSNGNEPSKSKTAHELIVNNQTKNPEFWGIVGIILLIVLILGAYYRKDLMSMIRRSKK